MQGETHMQSPLGYWMGVWMLAEGVFIIGEQRHLSGTCRKTSCTELSVNSQAGRVCVHAHACMHMCMCMHVCVCTCMYVEENGKPLLVGRDSHQKALLASVR